jgi:hypothetical protein
MSIAMDSPSLTTNRMGLGRSMSQFIRVVARRTSQILYLGALVVVTAWGLHGAWSFTRVVASEIMALRHPDVLASDPSLERTLRAEALIRAGHGRSKARHGSRY